MTQSTILRARTSGSRFFLQLALLVAGLPLGCSSEAELPQDPRLAPPCSEGYSECAGGCVDLQTSANDCGSCGIVCDAGLTCQSGTCRSGVITNGTGGSPAGTGGEEGNASSGGSNGGGTFTTEVLLEEGGVGQCAVDGVLESTNAGFTGEGYLNSDNGEGASIEWALNVGEAGTYSLELTYAGESGDRPGDVIVNGTNAVSGVSFPATSSWTVWSKVSVDVALTTGENRIVLRSTSATGLANIDSLKVTGASLQALDCDGQSGGNTGGSGTGGTMGGTGGTGGADQVAPCAANQLASCSQGTDEIACHFGGDPGDYRVTVELGGEGAGDMVVDAEMHRSMLGQTITTNGETKRFAFTVNVRTYEGQPVDPDQKGSSKGIPGLDVYVRGAAPKLTAICREAIKPEPKIWLAGDSTVCDQGSLDYSGWGQHLPQFFDDSVSVANYADSGESSASFLGGAKLWKAITAGWTSGDWVLIQLGHNDKNITPSAFEGNIRTMITQAKAAGVRPILVTPISRAGTALASQHVNSTGANLPQIIRSLGTSESVPVLDMTVITSEWLATVDWKTYFALGTDRTHPNPRGAEIVAGLVAEAIREENIELADHLR